MRRSILVAMLLVATYPAWSIEEPVDLDAVTKIRDEGFNRAQVVEMARHLTDRIGPRLTGSPQLVEANEWTLKKLESWGLEGRLEAYPIEHGWSYEHCDVHLVSPYLQTLFALPKAWTPGTDGRVRSKAVRVTLEKEADLEEYRGQLRGAVLLLDPVRIPEQIEKDMFSRFDEGDLAELERFDIPEEDRKDWREEYREKRELWNTLAEFMVEEGVIATLEVSSRDHGLVRVTDGGTYGLPGLARGVPALVMAAEHYNRLVRLVDDDVDVELEIDVKATFHDDIDVAYNTVADLEGTDLADQLVMVGGHLDSWHAGTGATDNGANCAVVMEAVRILKAAGLQPRRTVRVVLWTGEEQGYWGSEAYVKQHLAKRPEPTDPEQLELPEPWREQTWPITPLEDHSLVSAYFNIDFGVGRIRGIYTQENAGVRPIFERWLAPLRDLGVTTLTMESESGTDIVPLDGVGLPAFAFIQDPLEYMTRTHHTNVDTFDHVPREDLMHNAVVLATFLWHAANREELLPRKPMPQPPPEEQRPTQEQ